MLVKFRDPNALDYYIEKAESFKLSLRDLVWLTNKQMYFHKRNPNYSELLWGITSHIDDLFESEFCDDPIRSKHLINLVIRRLKKVNTNVEEDGINQKTKYFRHTIKHLLNELLIYSDIDDLRIEFNDFDKKIEEDKQKERELLSDSPFNSIQQIRTFIYLNEHYHENDKKKWSYIFYFLKDNLGYEMSDVKFMRFISRNYQKVSDRVQSSANQQKVFQLLEEIYSNM